jgi:hypothetical protein
MNDSTFSIIFFVVSVLAIILYVLEIKIINDLNKLLSPGNKLSYLSLFVFRFPGNSLKLNHKYKELYPNCIQLRNAHLFIYLSTIILLIIIIVIAFTNFIL